MNEQKRAEYAAQDLALRSAGITDSEAREALDGYLQAAAFTATDEDGGTLDGLGLSFSGEAQDQARADLFAFISANVAECREFQQVTGHGWLQVGIDFNFTRNGQGAGFWDRGAGDVGVSLTEKSKPYGSATVVLSETGEMEFI